MSRSHATWLGSRRRLLGLAGVGGLWLLARGQGALARSGRASLLGGLRITNESVPWAGDGPRLATVARPGGAARLTFTLAKRATVTLAILETGQGIASEQPSKGAEAALGTTSATLGPGAHTLVWSPPSTLAPRTYVARVSARALDGRTQSTEAVVRLLGVDAAFSSRSAKAGDTAPLVIRAQAKSLTLQLLRSGPETEPTYADDVIKGVAIGDPVAIDWTMHRDGAGLVELPLPAVLSSGVYAAQLTTDDGRVGFAPLIVRPSAPGARAAVVMPTSTWGAYNFYDADGDGWGDTWYARWKTNVVDLTRPHASRGVPSHYRSYDLGFQRWLAQTGKAVDTYADEDVEEFATPDELRAAYDLLVFPGHTEYVTERLYDLVEGFRDLGGNLMFLSANNFFRKIERTGTHQQLVDEWRDLGRPESALLGNQYIASDRGRRRAPFTVVGADSAPWAFESTGLANGATFGLYGIEIDARSAVSPAGTIALAQIPNLLGAGRTAEMTYYEHASGARVFAAGALDFGGQMLLWPATAQIVQNVWARLTAR